MLYSLAVWLENNYFITPEWIVWAGVVPKSVNYSDCLILKKKTYFPTISLATEGDIRIPLELTNEELQKNGKYFAYRNAQP